MQDILRSITYDETNKVFTSEMGLQRYLKTAPQYNDGTLTDAPVSSTNKLDKFESLEGFIIPIVILTAKSFAKYSTNRSLFIKLARQGVLFFPTTALVNSFRLNGKANVKAQLAPFNAHNQKLGFNFYTGSPRGYYTISSQSMLTLPTDSQYKDAVKACVALYKEIPDLKSHYDKIAAAYESGKTTIKEIARLQQQQRVTYQPIDVEALPTQEDFKGDYEEDYYQVEKFGYAQPVQYRQRYEDNQDFNEASAKRGVTIGDIHLAMASLPQIMQGVASIIEGIPDRDYALSVISPFHAASKGARIPNLQPIQTVTGTNFQDLGTFSVPSPVSLMFTSFTCFNTPPWVLFSGLTQAVLDQTPVQQTVTYFFDAPAIVNGQVEYNTRLVSLPYATTLAFNQNSQFGVSPNVQGLFSAVRVASAGYRIFKTSASTTESGIIKAFYSDRGTYIARNIAQMLNYFQDDQSHIRVYCAGGAGESMGRAGFMLGTIYQPLDVQETQTFTDSKRLSISDTTQLPDGSWAQTNQQGPIRLVFSVPAQQNVIDREFLPGNYYLLDTDTYAAVADNTLTTNGWYLDVDSLQQKHMTIVSFEGVQPDTSFEFQWVVHYEGVPSSESQYLETEMCILSPKYSSALDILRRFDFSDFRSAPQLNIDDMALELMAGIFQRGFFQKAGNLLHKGVEGIKRNKNIREKLLQLSMPIANAILSKIPGGSAITPIVNNAIQQRISDIRGVEDEHSGDIAQHYRQNAHIAASYATKPVHKPSINMQNNNVQLNTSQISSINKHDSSAFL